ncbi:hypothetical protein [Brevundimonas diminuta]|uniref:hypothetical protein n=1 Tax=Brevundimonas diminuta TaxID=293 RepID=UPI001F56EF79|nr:hypothetical protein [Brevundimonas diminuta]
MDGSAEGLIEQGPQPQPQPQQVAAEHLAPMVFEMDVEGRAIRIGVRFSNHCFTEKWDAVVHAGQPVILDGGNRARVFCPVRFELSQGLPDLVRGLPNGHVHQTPEANYVKVTAADGAEYRMFFNIKRGGHQGDGCDASLFVESAYPPDGEGLAIENMTKVRFRVLVSKTLRGQKVKRFSR